MPRYYFHIRDHQLYEDLEGSELPDLEAARIEAFRTLGNLLNNKGVCHSEWLVDITNAAGHSLLKLTLSINETRAASIIRENSLKH